MEGKISVLFIGDIVGEAGMKAAELYLPDLIKKYEADFVIVNGENADKGKGITLKESNKLFELGAHIITTGNHIWDNWQSKPLLSTNPKVLRPFNYPPGNAGRGYAFHTLEDNTTVCVLQLQGRTYMQAIDCPFRAADNVLRYIYEKTKIIIVDFHADATAEKISLGWYLDGKVSALLGTHTHIPTADATILPEGTAYITDVGMTGPYDSVVGMRKDIAQKRFILQTAHKYEMGEGDIKISGANVIIDKLTGKSDSIEPFTYPEFKRIKAVVSEISNEGKEEEKENL